MATQNDIKTEDFLAAVAFCIGKVGYQKDGETARSAYYMLRSGNASATAEDRATAVATIARAKECMAEGNRDSLSEFEYSMHLAVLEETKSRADGRAAYAVEALRLKREEAERSKLTMGSNFFGALAQRHDLSVKLIALRPYNTPVSSSFVHEALTSDSNVVVWFGSQKLGAVGDALNVRGTIKAHKAYRGVNQTVLSRVKLA